MYLRHPSGHLCLNGSACSRRVGPDAEIHATLVAMECAREELRAHDRELYIKFPNGMARPKLSMPKVERISKTAYTDRNGNTVQKLLEMALAARESSK